MFYNHINISLEYIMELTRDEEFLLFDTAIQSVIDANILMIGGRFEDLLKLIAYNHDLRSCVADCYKTINYERLLKKCLTVKDNVYKFRLPESKKGIVGFVTKLIYEFVKTTQIIENVLKQLYPDLDSKSAYGEFCKEVFTPYRLAFREIFLYDENVDQEDDDHELPTTISTAAANEIYSIVKEMRSELDGDNKIDRSLRRDLNELLDNFTSTIEDDNPKQVRPAWIGLKLSFVSSKKSMQYLDKIEDVLIRFSLI